MKRPRSIKCKNGNVVERFYDKKSRSSVTVVKSPDGNQIGDADYSGNKDSALSAMIAMVKENGGAIDAVSL